MGPTEAGGSSLEVSSSILNRAFWAAQTLMAKGKREALRAAARGMREDKLPGTLPRNENWGCVGGEVPQEGKAKGKDQREEGRIRKERKGTQS